MRFSGALVLLAVLAAGCTPAIPESDTFGTSALVPAGTVPTEFAEFNGYDPNVATLVATQICATPYQPLAQQSVEATPGRIIAAKGRCADHVPITGEPLHWALWK